jgi:anti-sigma factor RsiW
MRCSTVLSLLDDHLDGLLPPARSEELRAHLDACADCDAEAEALRCVTAPLSAWVDLEPPAGCFDRILERIAALPAEAHVPVPPPPAPVKFAGLQRLRGGARWFVTSGAAAAAVLLAAAAVERAGDLDDPGRNRDRSSRIETSTPDVSFARTRLFVTDDMEARDGLLRTPALGAFPPGPASDFAVPATADPFGASPR